MKVLYYDVFCGISGDMNLGALVDLGVDLQALKRELKKLNIDEEFDLEVRRDMKHGITGSKVDVILHNQKVHHHDHNHGHHHHHEHRNFALIRDMIQSSDLKDKVKDLAIQMFRLVAEAEGKVHGKPLEEVHFHEVGATDSIVDIVGAAICLDILDVDQVMASTIQVGGGFVKCAHGRMPVPAPATAEILADVPLNYNIVPFETTTPTGAAILKATVSKYSDQHTMKVLKTGYGMGTKDFDVPNVLRVYLGEIQDTDNDLIHEKQYLMSCNIDDMNGELIPYVEERLFEAGALDVYKSTIMMKKGRVATKLDVLFRDENRQALQKILFLETTTAGLRELPVDKYMMQRRVESIKTQYGDIKVKYLMLSGEVVKHKAEYEDCLKASKIHNVNINQVYKSVEQQLNID